MKVGAVTFPAGYVPYCCFDQDLNRPSWLISEDAILFQKVLCVYVHVVFYSLCLNDDAQIGNDYSAIRSTPCNLPLDARSIEP